MLEVGLSHAKPVVRRRRRALLVALLILGLFGGLAAFLVARSSSSTGDGSSFMQAIFPPSPLELWRARGKASEPYVAAYGDCGGLWLRDMTWSVDGSKIYVAAVGGVQILERQGKRLVTTRSIPFQHGPYCIAADPKGRWAAVGVWHGLGHSVPEPDNPCYVDIFSTTTWEKITRLEEPTYDVMDVRFAPDGEHLVAKSGHTTVLVWRTSDWSLTRTFEEFHDLVQGGTFFTPSGGLLVCDGVVKNTGATVLKYRHVWEGDWEWSKSFASAPYGWENFGWPQFLHGEEREMICWVSEPLDADGYRYPGGIERRRFNGNFDRIAWAPCGMGGPIGVGMGGTVAAMANEFPGFVALWRTSDLKPIAYLGGIRKQPCVTAFHPDDKMLATAWGTGNIVIWDVPRIVADEAAGRLPPILKEEDDNHWGRTPIEESK